MNENGNNNRMRQGRGPDRKMNHEQLQLSRLKGTREINMLARYVIAHAEETGKLVTVSIEPTGVPYVSTVDGPPLSRAINKANPHWRVGEYNAQASVLDIADDIRARLDEISACKHGSAA